MAADRTGRIWDEVRRALGRVAGRVATHALPEAQAGIAVSVRRSASTKFAEAEPGVQSADWQPFAQVWGLPSPTASAGGGGIDSATVATVIGIDRALTADAAVVAAARCCWEAPPVHSWSLGRDMPGAPVVRGEPMRFGERPTQKPSVTFDAPSVRAWPVVPTTLPKSQQSPAPWQFRPIRVRAGLAPILRAPITCNRLMAPPGSASSAAFAPERQLLAAASGIPEADVALIGVFPHVPLGAVQKLSVTPDGTALQIWVRPEALDRGRSIPTVTVVLGRQRSTSKMLQAVRRGPERG